MSGYMNLTCFSDSISEILKNSDNYLSYIFTNKNAKENVKENIKKEEEIFSSLEKILFNNSDIQMNSNEIENGLKLFDIDPNINVFDFHEFKKMSTMLKIPKTCLFEDWRLNMKATACTDWNKQDENGNSFGGPWKYPEGSYEKMNAWDLSFDKSCQLMFDLPFSKEALLHTIKFGCSDRNESVKYSNFLCIWVLRKEHKMKVVMEQFLCNVKNSLPTIPNDLISILFSYFS